MDVKISSEEYEIVKDGVIVADADDIISFKFEDVTCKFIIKNRDEKKEDENVKPELSEDRKTVKLTIFTPWDNLNTTFSKKKSLVTYTEGEKKRELYLAYAVTGLKGKDFSSYIFRYTLYSKDISGE